MEQIEYLRTLLFSDIINNFFFYVLTQSNIFLRTEYKECTKSLKKKIKNYMDRCPIKLNNMKFVMIKVKKKKNDKKTVRYACVHGHVY